MTDMDWGLENELDDGRNCDAEGYMANTPKGIGINPESSAGKIIMMAILYALWLGILTLMASLNNMVFTWIIIIVSTIVGWKSITSIQPRMFLFMPFIGWAIYFGVKFFVSLFAGLVLTPWFVARWIFLRR